MSPFRDVLLQNIFLVLHSSHVLVCHLERLSSRRPHQTDRLVFKQLLGVRFTVCDDIKRAWVKAVACFEIRIQWRSATRWVVAACSCTELRQPHIS